MLTQLGPKGDMRCHGVLTVIVNLPEMHIPPWYWFRSGLMGIFLPSHPSFGLNEYDEYIVPPRLHYNVECGFAELYDWSESPRQVANWVDIAFSRRKTVTPDNSSIRFAKNWRGPRWYPQKPAGSK